MLKIFIRFIVFIISIIVLYLIIAVIFALVPVNSNFKQAKKGTEVYIVSNGVHTNIVLPVKNNIFDWTKWLKTNTGDKYLAFGWGDREFYMNTPSWSNLKFSIAFKAAFLPTKTIIQVYEYKQPPKKNKNTVKIVLNQAQFKKLSVYVLQSFKTNEKKQLIEIIPNKNYYFGVKFYPAKGKYSIFKTCNNWTNKGLKQAGIKNAVWAPFDKSVLYHLK